MLQVKENRVLQSTEEPATSFMARRLREISPVFVHDFLGPTVTLVPVPRSSLQKPGALWPARELAAALHREGFGCGVLSCLKRTQPVLKAATAPAKERPRPRAHFESLHVLDPMALPAEVTLVDDVITRGAQLIGAAWAIWAVRPDIQVRAFAFIRTLSDPQEFERILAPCVGKIEVHRGESFRVP
jgi:predicted amidophosphoribosyltransferase